MHLRSSYLLAATLITLEAFIPLIPASSRHHFPIGISIGTDQITSAYITEDDDFVTVSSVKTTQDWKEFSRSLLRLENKNQQYTKTEVDILLTKALSSIKDATETKLNWKVEILAITYPAYIPDYGYLRNLLDIAMEILPGINDGTQVWPYLHSLRQAYGLNNAEALGYPSGTNIDHEENLLLHLDYQNNVLEVSITSITKRTTNVERRFRVADFGGVKQIASPKKLEHLGLRTKALVDEELSVPSDIPIQHSDFKRIIFSGDAPASESKKIREAIVKSIPELSDRLIESIEPGWVGAVGAARRAKEYKLNPPVIDIQEQIIDWNPKDGHDEL